MDEKLKRAQSLVGTSSGRPIDDFYVTPGYAVEELLKRVQFGGSIWECACGDGAISKCLQKNGYPQNAEPLVSTDLIDRGYGIGNHDFLTSTIKTDNIITNPPYNLAEQFVKLSLERTTKKVALLLKLQFLEGQKRKEMFENTPLKTVYVFSKRLSMYRNGEKGNYASGMIAYAWFVWDHEYNGKPILEWI